MKIDGKTLNLDGVCKVAFEKVQVELDSKCKNDMEFSRKFIEGKLKAGETIYGVNTGFGFLSSVKIPNEQIEELQRNIVRSHSVGVGPLLSEPEVRAILLLRANALARGHSGVRPVVVEKILEFLNANIIPVVPGQGSVGASGDLAPLSHVALVLMGEGEVLVDGVRKPTANVLAEKNISPLKLAAKEGLSLVNGCQVMTAIGMVHSFRARRLNWLLDTAGAMSLEGLKGSRSAFDPLISGSRPHPGEAKTARNLLKILETDSEIGKSHENCDKVQDAYSLRCMPQVHGAVKDTLRRTVETLEIEANSSTDNPLVFAKEGKILSGGNFHGEPVAFALDFLGIAVSAASSISECRIEKLINPSMSGLPAMLAKNSGLNSGHMIVQVAAASVVSENKILSHPASVDSIPTNADKEDHVSMGTIAARKLGMIVDNAEKVCAMEFLSASQALDFHRPLKASKAVQVAHSKIREKIPFAENDRAFYQDIEAIRGMIDDGSLLKSVNDSVGELEW